MRAVRILLCFASIFSMVAVPHFVCGADWPQWGGGDNRNMISNDGLDRSISTVAVADGLVYVPDIAGRFHCLDADTGQCYWVHDTKSETWGGPLIADGKMYFGNKKYFFVMAPGKEPKLISEIRLGHPVYSTPIAANGVLYVASQHYLWAVGKN